MEARVHRSLKSQFGLKKTAILGDLFIAFRYNLRIIREREIYRDGMKKREIEMNILK